MANGQACKDGQDTDQGKIALVTGASSGIGAANGIALVTGASSGIGAAAARKLSNHNLIIALVARRLDRLKELKAEILACGGKAEIFQADLSREDERETVFREVTNQLGEVDVLINNAGLGWYGYYSEMPWSVAGQMLEVNVNAVAHLTSLFLPQMRRRDRGHIINIGSIAGGFPNQGVALYSASKSFLDAFTTGLHRELAGSRLKVSVVRAGPVHSEFFDQAARQAAGSRIPAERFGISPERVAECIWDLIQRPRRVVYVPQVLSITPWIELFFGRLVDRLGPLLLRRLHKI